MIATGHNDDDSDRMTNGYDFAKDEPKNEQKTSAFIALKHMITNTTALTYVDTCHLMQVYLELRSEPLMDKELIKQMLVAKHNELFK